MGVLTYTTAQLETDVAEGLENQPKSNEVWDDLRFPATQAKLGSLSKPDFDETNIGLLFPQNNTDEIAFIVGQMPHARKADSEIRPHLHYVQTTATLPVFKLSYRWYNNGSVVPAYTTLTSTTATFTYTSGSILQILSFPAINGAGKGVSSIIDIKVYRDDNLITGDVLVKEFDLHYQIDQLGSRSEFVK